MNSKKNKFLDLSCYKLMFPIGSGSFSRVYQVKDINTDEIYAAKVSKHKIDKKKKHSQETLLLFREVNLLSLLNHPSIIKFIGYSQVNFENSPHPTIVTEFATNGSLRDIINMEISGLSPEDWTITNKLIIIYGIAAGMSYLHANNVLHRDLKPENILIDDFLHPKISDFGMSKITDLTDSKFQSTKGIKGTYMYIAPEIFSVPTYSKEADVYAFAYIIYEVLTGDVPFEKFQLFQILQKVAIEGYRPSIKSDVPRAYQELIESCWSQKPDERPSFEQIVEKLKTNEDFITETTDESEFFQYVDFVDSYKSTFDTSNQLISFEDFIKVRGRKNHNKKTKLTKKQDDQNALKKEDQINDIILFNPLQFEELSLKCRTLVEEAQSNPTKQFIVGKSLIEGINGFPQIITIGLQYIAQSNSHNYTESIIYYIRLLIKGKIILQDLNEAERYNEDFVERNQKSEFFFLDGKINNKKNQINEALRSFEEGSKEGNSECIYKSAKMLFLGKGCNKDDQKVAQLLTQLKDQGYSKSEHFFTALNAMNNMKEFTKLQADAQFVFISNIIKNLQENKDEAMFKRLVIKSNITEQLFFNKSLKSTNFHACIKRFNEIIIEVEYPSKVFKRIVDLISKIRLQNGKFIKIGIIFASFQETVNKYCFSHSISYHSIDKSFYFLPEYAFCGCELLERFIVPSSLISIGKYAFSDCSSLTEISIPSSVVEIKDFAFQKCTNLEEISIPFSVITIGNGAFSECSKLSKLSIPSSVTSIGKEAFFKCSSLEQISINCFLSEIKEGTFKMCTNLDNILFSSSVTVIGKEAFCECTSLTQISIPPSVTLIEDNAFSGCLELQQVSLPSSETKFDDNIFEGISSLIIQGNIKYIPKTLFYKSSSITQVTIPSSVLSIEESAFHLCASLRQVSFEIPCSITEIGKGVFHGCSSLTQIEIPSTVTSIGSNAFYLCSSLVQVTLPSSVTSIGDHLFFGCSLLEKVTILSSITSIGADTFSGCSSLKEISIPSSVTLIEKGAFNKCSSLEQLIIPSSVTEIGDGAFNGCSLLKQLSIPPSVNSLGVNTFSGCTSLTKLSIPSSIKTFFIGINKSVIVKE